MKSIHYLILALLYFLSTHLKVDAEQPCVLVTGGAGYIGSHTCKALKEAGFNPVTYDSLALGRAEFVKWGPLVVGDLLDLDALDLTFSRYRPIAVIHLAGLRNVGESVKNPCEYYDTNVVGSINLLKTMQKHNVKQIIFSSSCTVYGYHEDPISEEETNYHPISPYARSKFMAENIIEDFASAYNLTYIIFRYFNAAGIDLESGLFRSTHSQNFLIPRAISAALKPENPLLIFGSDYPTSDGSAVRDYIHVKDLARAHVLALKHLQSGFLSEKINLGTGVGHSVFEIIQTIEHIGQKPVSWLLTERQKGDAPYAVALISKAEKILGFKPEFSDIQTIIKDEWVSMQRMQKNK